MDSALHRTLARSRAVTAAALVLVCLMAWAWLLAGAGMDMDAFEMTRHSLMAMGGVREAPWDLAYAGLMFSMWWVMMIAMMLPAAAPVVLLAARVNAGNRTGKAVYGSGPAFMTGYLLAWGGFSGVAVAAQWALDRSGLLNPVLVGNSRLLAAGLLLLAGAWQFTPWKQACLSHCRSPVEFLSRNHRPGNRGAVVMGLAHGAYCVGCCWFLMGLLFVGGVMNLWWIVFLTGLVAVEKLLPAGHALARLLGGALLAWGAWLLLG